MSEHYFSADPTSDDRRHSVRVSAWGREFTLESAAGVFSAGRVDRGTDVLLRSATPRTESRVLLDLGCGYGVITCALGLAVSEALVWAVDVNSRARELCAANADRLGIGGRVVVREPDEVSPDEGFDEIWSNPPVRVGKQELHAMLERWLGRLAPGGRAVIVIGKNLGGDSLQRWLDDEGFAARRLASAKGFRVIQCGPRE